MNLGQRDKPPPQYGATLELSTFIGQGETIKMTPANIGHIADGFVYGYLRYSDIFGGIHRAGFGLTRTSETEAWLISGGAIYNYHRIESDWGQK